MPILRQQIVNAVLARMRTISTNTAVSGQAADYYATSVGAHVFEWRDLGAMPFDGLNDLEALSVNDFEEQEDTEDQVLTRVGKLLKFDIRFATNLGTNTESVAERCRKIMADIERCIGVDRKWTVDGTMLARDSKSPEKNEMAVQQAGRVIGAGHVVFAIRYRHQFFNQYSQ